MAKPFNIDDLDVTPEEKKLILRALTDKSFRDRLEQRAASGDALSDDELDEVAGGAGASADVSKVLAVVRDVKAKSTLGGQVLCGGGCGIA